MKGTLFLVLLLLPLWGFPQQERPLSYNRVIAPPENWTDGAGEAGRRKFRELIDRVAADGYNMMQCGPFYFSPMSFVDYSQTPYPEAAQYPSKVIERNIAAFRENIRYAKSKGIKYIMLWSFSLYAPVNFWKAHQQELNPGGIYDRYLRTAHQSPMFEKALAGKPPFTVPHQQWHNDYYRKFFIYSYEKMLDNIPEIDGLVTCFAEAAWAVDEDKLRGQWNNPLQVQDRVATESHFLDYVNTLYNILKRKRGDGFLLDVNEWYTRAEVMGSIALPKENLILTARYAGADQPLANPPPWAEDWVKKGYHVLLEMHGFDAEWPAPIYFYSTDFINRMVDGIRNGGFAGISYLDYRARGEDPADNPIKMLWCAQLGARIQGRNFTEEDAIIYLNQLYGSASKNVINSLTAVCDEYEAYIKLQPHWFWRGDGLVAGNLEQQSYWMFDDNPEAPERMGFVRQNVISVKEYVAAALLGDDALERSKKKWKAEGKLTPLEVIDLMIAKGDKAVDEILLARKLSPSAPYMQDMVASALINRLLTDRCCAYIRSALYYFMSGYEWDGKSGIRGKRRDTGYDYREQCLEEWNRNIALDVLIYKLRAKYAPRARALNANPSYSFAKQVVSQMGATLKIPEYDQSEYDRISQLIEGGIK